MDFAGTAFNVLVLIFTAFIALVLVAASPGGPFGAKLAQAQRGDAVAGAALMSSLAVVGTLSVPIFGAFILSRARVEVDDLSIAIAPLILRIVASQIVPFSIGVVARAVRSAAPVLAVVSAEFTDEPSILPAVAAIVTWSSSCSSPGTCGSADAGRPPLG